MVKDPYAIAKAATPATSIPTPAMRMMLVLFDAVDIAELYDQCGTTDETDMDKYDSACGASPLAHEERTVLRRFRCVQTPNQIHEMAPETGLTA